MNPTAQPASPTPTEEKAERLKILEDWLRGVKPSEGEAALDELLSEGQNHDDTFSYLRFSEIINRLRGHFIGAELRLQEATQQWHNWEVKYDELTAKPPPATVPPAQEAGVTAEETAKKIMRVLGVPRTPHTLDLIAAHVRACTAELEAKLAARNHVPFSNAELASQVLELRAKLAACEREASDYRATLEAIRLWIKNAAGWPNHPIDEAARAILSKYPRRQQTEGKQ